VICRRNVAEMQSSGRDWTEDQSYVAFPRVTLCDFRIRGQDLGNVQRYTVQCVLPINAYTEKIYGFLWFWMVVVAFASSASFVMWAVRSVTTGDKLRFIANHLKIGDRIAARPALKETEQVRKFTRDYLKQDGSFLLRLIAHNTDNITTTELICSIWDGWKESYVVGVDTSPIPDSGNHSGGGLYPDMELKALQMQKC
jgi:innexin